jgi:uncharacterized protein DUF4054
VTVTVASFRADFPAFADTTIYPDATVTLYLTVAGNLLNATRWGDMLDFGTELFIAHNLVLDMQANAQAANSAPPGVTTGAISAKSVDKVSISYDVSIAGIEGGDFWNLSTYGIRFLHYAKMMGAGPIQIGVACYVDPLGSYNAWPGLLYGDGGIPNPSQ